VERRGAVNTRSETYSAFREIFSAALKAVNPGEAVRGHFVAVERTIRRSPAGRIFLLSFGKAAYQMALPVVEAFGGRIVRGIVITKHGHLGTEPLGQQIRCFEAGHPLPDQSGLMATTTALEELAAAGRDVSVVCLVSGGGSAIFVAPMDPVTLAEKQAVTDALLKAGADIGALNTVRKHLSRVKGGRLAGFIHPRPLLSFILSDVIGDRLDVIASGPTAPDSSTYQDAFDVLSRSGLAEKIPEAALRLIAGGTCGETADTPKPGSPVFDGVENIIVGSNGIALAAAVERAGGLGFNVSVLSSELAGEASVVGRDLARRALSIKAERATMDRPLCILAGGETTVTVTGSGVGGRNTEMALAFAREIAGAAGIAFLSAGTDGTDGPTDAAGAMVDGSTVADGLHQGLDADDHLARNDSYTFFSKAGGLFMTGPTGTNVMDLQIILVQQAG
jgi:glycerate-2-kinase